MPFALTPERDRELSEILTRYPNKMAACIPALHLCQDQHGWVSDDIVDFVSKKLDLPTSHVKGVVTFYTLFNQHPVGKHQVWVCRTLPCALRGAGNVLAQCEKKLGIKPGETTKDGKVTLRTAECLASCGTAPMMQVDRDYHENLSKEDVDKILDGLISGRPVAPKLAPPMPPIDKALPEKKSTHVQTMLGTAPQANAPVTTSTKPPAPEVPAHLKDVPVGKTMLGTAPPANAPVTTSAPPPPARPDVVKPDVDPVPPAAGIAGAGTNVGAGAKEKDPLKGTMLGLGTKPPPPPTPVSGSVKPPGGSVPPPPLPNRVSQKPPPVPPKPLSVPPKPIEEDALRPDEEAKTKKGES